MNYVNEAPRTLAGIGTGWFSTLAADFAANQRRRRSYRETVNQLSAMTDAELDDIGLSRLMIKEVAHEASRRA